MNQPLATYLQTSTVHIGNRWLGHSGLAMYDNTARLHDPLLMRFASPDPLYAKFGWLSPWSHCAADPLNHFDPDGRAKIFFQGRYIGNDGIDDGRVYTIADPKGTVYEADGERASSIGFSEEVTSALIREVKDHDGDSKAFRTEGLYNSMVKLPGTKKSISAMVDEFNKDDGTNTNDDNFREFGGIFSNEDPDKFTPVKPGPVTRYNGNNGSIGFPDGYNSTAHSHPSGVNKYLYVQLPSPADFNVPAGTIHYMVAIRDNKIYIHNDKGILCGIDYDEFKRMFSINSADNNVN